MLPFAAPLAGKSANRRPFQTAISGGRFLERNVVPIQGIQACTDLRQHRSFCGEHLPASRRLGGNAVVMVRPEWSTS